VLGVNFIKRITTSMKIKLSGILLSAVALVAVVGCSDSQAKASPAEEKSFAGGPPPAGYMDAANKATEAARAKQGAAPQTP
jgi:hypothetical protein